MMKIANEMRCPVIHMKLNNGQIMSMCELLKMKRDVMFRPDFMKVTTTQPSEHTFTFIPCKSLKKIFMILSEWKGVVIGK